MGFFDFSYQQPGFDIVRSAHSEYVVKDLARAREFYVDLLGLVVTEEDGKEIYLRGYEERLHHSLLLKEGETPHIGHISFRVRQESDLDLLEEHFTALGCSPFRVKDVEAGQGTAVRVVDPLGFPVEFFLEMDQVPTLLQRFDLYRGPGVMRLDHFNLHVPNPEHAFEHYKKMGFRCSEYTSTDDSEERLWAAWMFRKPTVHDVALMNGKGPRLHHTGWWVSDPSSILRACDQLAAAGHASSIERGPGRHGLSNAFFLYLRDPDGHRVELYTGDYYTGDPDHRPIRWSVNDPRRGTFWGHPAPLSWFEESSPVSDYQGGLAALADEKLKERPPVAT